MYLLIMSFRKKGTFIKNITNWIFRNRNSILQGVVSIKEQVIKSNEKKNKDIKPNHKKSIKSRQTKYSSNQPKIIQFFSNLFSVSKKLVLLFSNKRVDYFPRKVRSYTLQAYCYIQNSRIILKQIKPHPNKRH